MSVIVEKLCEQYRKEWATGRPDLSAFLSSLSENDRRDVAPHLIEIDVSHRVRAGEQPTPDDYRQLLSREELSRLSDVFSPEAWSRSTGTHAAGKTWIGNSSIAPPIERTKIGRYEVLGVLGEGAFGTVYRAYDSKLSREVAIKVPRLGDANDEERIASLLKEAEAAASLSHPNIVTVLDSGELEDGGCYVVFELVEGGHLGHEIRKGQIPVEQAVDLMIQIAKAVHHAHHEKDLYHRDLKPANILISKDGRPLITDFGLAISDDRQFETKGEISGTLAYMSPEQTRGESHLLDGRSDIWSLGVIFYEMLTGKRPFVGTTHEQLFEQIQQRDPRPLRQINDSIPAPLERVCLKCLNRAITKRYATARDLVQELTAFSRAAPKANPGEPSLLDATVSIRHVRAASAPPEIVNLPLPTTEVKKTTWTVRRTVAAIAVSAAAIYAISSFSGSVQPTREKAWTAPAEFDRQAEVGRWYDLFDRVPVPLVWPTKYKVYEDYNESRHDYMLNTSHTSLVCTGATGSESYSYRVTIYRNNMEHSAGLFWGYRTLADDGSVSIANLLTVTVVNLKHGESELRLELDEVTFNIMKGGRAPTSNNSINSCPIDFPEQSEAELQVDIHDGILTRVIWAGKDVSGELLDSVRSQVKTLSSVGPLGLKQAKVECRIVIRVGAAAISWQVSARGMFEFCVAA